MLMLRRALSRTGTAAAAASTVAASRAAVIRAPVAAVARRIISSSATAASAPSRTSSVLIAAALAGAVTTAISAAVSAADNAAESVEYSFVPDGQKESIRYLYELRIRQMSTPEKVFEYFASVTTADGELRMTPVDFMLAVLPVATRKSKRTKRLSAAAKRLFDEFDVNGDGLISFGEFMFLSTLLAIREKDFVVAFRMFDTSGDGRIDRDEFVTVMLAMKDRTAIGQLARDGRRSIRDSSHSDEFVAVCHGAALFGGADSPKASFTFPEFKEYMLRLKRAMLQLEFDYYDSRGVGTISAQAFALSVIGYARMQNLDGYLARVRSMPEPLRSHRVSLVQFEKFGQFLQHFDDVNVAIETYGAVSGGLDVKALSHAAYAVSGLQLDPTTVAVMVHIFDEDGNGLLDASELSAVLERRAHNGIKRNNLPGAGFFRCCLDCVSQ